MVVAYHATVYMAELPPAELGWKGWVAAVFSRLWIGVPIFFVISGYCISASADGLRRRPAPLRRYFLRRFRRIFPPFWATVLIGIIIVSAGEFLLPGLFFDDHRGIPVPWSLDPIQWLGNLTLTEVWRWHLGGSELRYFLGHAWTLCYEEQFYAVMGLLLFISRRHLFVNALLLTIAVGCVAVAGLALGIDMRGFFFDGRWLFFAAGILVFWALNQATPMQRGLAVVVLVLPLALMLLWPERLTDPVANLSQEAWASFAFAIILLQMHRFDEALVRARVLKPLLWCGVRCYSIYLMHFVLVKLVAHGAWLLGLRAFEVTMLVTVPLSLAVSIVAGGVFHRYVERRFLNTPSTVAAQTAGRIAPPVAAA